MIVYIVPFLLTIIGALRYDIFQASRGKDFLFLILYIYLNLIIGLRYMVGGDSYFYSMFFDTLRPNDLLNLSINSEYQPLFLQSMIFAKVIYPKFVSYQILHALLINTVLFWFIRRNSEYIYTVLFFCLIIFYINFTVEVLRESLAVLVFIVNYKNLEKRKWLHYVIGVFISMMFHLSATYLFLLPFLRFLKFNLFYFIFSIIFAFGLTQIQSFLGILGGIEKIQGKITFYASTSSSFNTIVLFLVGKFVIPVSFFYYAKNVLRTTIRYESLMCLLGLFGIGTVFNTLIFMRLSNYLLPFFCVAMVDVLVPYLRSVKAKMSQLIMIITIFCSIIAMGYLSFFWPTGYYKKWVPYMSIFSTEAERGILIYRD